MRRHLLRERAESADRRRQHDEIGIAHGRPASVAVQRIREADFARAFQRLRRDRRIARDMRGKARAAHRMRHRRADQADADQRDFGEERLGIDRHARAHEFGERGGGVAVGLFAADGQPQAIGQAVIGDAAQDDARARRGTRRRLRAVLPVVREMDQDEIADAVVDAQARACGSRPSARRAISRYARRTLRHARDLSSAAAAGTLRRQPTH